MRLQGFTPGKAFKDEGDFDPDWAEWLSMAQIYGGDVHEVGLTDYDLIVMFGHGGKPLGPRELAAQRVMALISKMEAQGESFAKMIMLGWVFQFLEMEQRFPTVSDLASTLGISRGAYYRRYSPDDLPRACDAVRKLSGGLLDQDVPIRRRKANSRP